ncbi:MAG: DUF930 domain-containing protein [Devosia sp.]
MIDAAPIDLPLAESPRRDRRILVTAAVSVLLHLLILGLILLPRVPAHAPEEPLPVLVELVPPSVLSSFEPPSSEAPSSEAPSSALPSSAAPSSEAPSSAEPSEAISSAEPSSAEPASSVAPPSSTAPSAAASEEASASEAPVAPQVPPARPVVIPVGPTDASSEPISSTGDASASAASSTEISSAPLLTAEGGEAGDGVDQAAADAPPPPDKDLLHAAKHFYLRDMLDAPALARTRDALKKLPPEKRVAQTCNLEAIGQIGNAGLDLNPDALVASAFAKPVVAGTSYSVSNGAFRSGQHWHTIAYECTLSKDFSSVTHFSFHIGADVTAIMQAQFGG